MPYMIVGELEKRIVELLRRLGRKQTEEFCEDLEVAKKFRKICESLKTGEIRFDVTGTITGWDAGCETIFGFGAAQVVGKNFAELPTFRSAEDFDQMRPFLEHVRAGHEVKGMVVERQRGDGQVITCTLDTAPVLEGGQVVAAVTTVQCFLPHSFPSLKKVLCVAALLLTGCVSPQGWMHPETYPGRFDKELAYCEMVSTGSVPQIQTVQGPEALAISGGETISVTPGGGFGGGAARGMVNGFNMGNAFAAVAERQSRFDACMRYLGWKLVK